MLRDVSSLEIEHSSLEIVIPSEARNPGLFSAAEAFQKNGNPTAGLMPGGRIPAAGSPTRMTLTQRHHAADTAIRRTIPPEKTWVAELKLMRLAPTVPPRLPKPADAVPIAQRALRVRATMRWNEPRSHPQSRTTRG
jgi:hypothetical protein